MKQNLNIILLYFEESMILIIKVIYNEKDWKYMYGFYYYNKIQ